MQKILWIFFRHWSRKWFWIININILLRINYFTQALRFIFHLEISSRTEALHVRTLCCSIMKRLHVLKTYTREKEIRYIPRDNFVLRKHPYVKTSTATHILILRTFDETYIYTKPFFIDTISTATISWKGPYAIVTIFTNICKWLALEIYKFRSLRCISCTIFNAGFAHVTFNSYAYVLIYTLKLEQSEQLSILTIITFLPG